MCMSVFTTTAVQVYAAGDATTFFQVSDSGYADGEITYTIKLTPDQKKITGVILNVEFDGNALQVVDAGAVGYYDGDSNFVENIPGIYVTGQAHNNFNVYSIAYITLDGYNVGSNGAEFMQIKFRAISDERKTETVKFHCVEFVSDDGDDTNDIKKTDSVQEFYSHTFHTLVIPVVTQVNSCPEGLRIVWTESVGATSYNLYRKSSNESEWSLLASDIGDVTEYVDTTAVSGTIYSYTVSATNEGGTTDYDETGVTGLIVGSIDEISAVLVDGGAEVTWSALPGAQSYEIWRKLADSNDWGNAPLATMDISEGLSFTDRTLVSGNSYEYKVRGIIDTFFAESAKSDVVTYIETPETAVSNTINGLEIDITDVGNVDKYIIEKKIADGEFSLLTEINADNDLVYTDTDVTPGIKYTYSVKAVLGETTSVAFVTPEIERLGVVTVKEVSNKNGGIYVDWDALEGINSYSVAFTKESDEQPNIYEGITSTNFICEDVVSGETYKIFVCAEDETGRGGYENDFTVTYLATPEITSVSNINNGISVAWEAVAGAEEYNVYRAEKNSDNWSNIGTTSETVFVDEINETQHGVHYKYAVSAVKGDIESSYNTVGVEGMYFGTVSGISATVVKDGVVVSWNALEKADSYKVYRKTYADEDWIYQSQVNTNTYIDTNMTSGVIYFYKVEAMNGNNVAEMTDEPVQVKFVAVPEVVAKNVAEGIEITIKSVKGADSYVIEKNVNGEWKKLAELDAKQTKYVDTTVESEKSYSYRAYAVSTNGNGFVSDVATVTRMSSPKITSISNVVSGVKIKWEPVDDCIKYEVYRKSSTQSDWGEPIYEGEGTEFIDGTANNGVKYTYTINAWISSEASTGYDKKGKSITFVETPDMLSVANKDKGVYIKWSAVKGATGYEVYRKAGSAKSWTRIATVKGTNYTDTKKLVSGTNYKYTVKAVNRDYSGFDDTGLSIKYLAVAKLKSVANVTDGVQIKWNAVKGAKSYKVYRKDSGAKKWKYIGKSSTTTYTDKGVKKASGKTYKYTVCAVNGSSVGAYNNTGLSIKRLSNPALKSAVSSKAGITVKWGTVTGSSGYVVYRKTGKGSFKQIAVVKGAKKVSYIDKKTKKGTTYTYTVKAYSGSVKSDSNKGISCKDKH